MDTAVPDCSIAGRISAGICVEYWARFLDIVPVLRDDKLSMSSVGVEARR